MGFNSGFKGLISHSGHYFLGMKITNKDHGVTTYTNINTCSQSQPGHPFPPTVAQFICSPD